MELRWNGWTTMSKRKPPSIPKIKYKKEAMDDRIHESAHFSTISSLTGTTQRKQEKSENTDWEFTQLNIWAVFFSSFSAKKKEEEEKLSHMCSLTLYPDTDGIKLKYLIERKKWIASDFMWIVVAAAEKDIAYNMMMSALIIHRVPFIIHGNFPFRKFHTRLSTSPPYPPSFYLFGPVVFAARKNPSVLWYVSFFFFSSLIV